MDIMATVGASRAREPIGWAFTAGGLIAGGALGAVVGFGLALQFLSANFFIHALVTLVGWAAGAAVGAAIGMLGAQLTRQFMRRPPAGRP